jgi:hypothetical protein
MEAVESRQYPRFGLGLPVTLVFQGRGTSEPGELQDISYGGCFFKSAAEVDLNRKISVMFSTGEGKTCRASGHVIRTTAYRGFAVLFEDGNDSIADFIQDLTGVPQSRRAEFLSHVISPEIHIL